MKILLITSSFDLTADYMISKFDSKTFFRVNTDMFSDYQFKISSSPFYFTINSPVTRVGSSEIKSVYLRKPTVKNINSQSDLITKSIWRLCFGLIESFDGKCLTKPSILTFAENKIVQLKEAEKIGLKLPQSLITNNKVQAKLFCESYSSVIFKFLCNSSYSKADQEYALGTNILQSDDNLNGIENIPIYFQEYQDKTYEVRVVIVNNKVYPIKILSQESESTKIDWRREIDILTYEMEELPQSIKEKLLILMNNLGIKYGALDLIFHNGEYYFLEVNPNGQWLWLERKLQLDISDEIYNYLME